MLHQGCKKNPVDAVMRNHVVLPGPDGPDNATASAHLQGLLWRSVLPDGNHPPVSGNSKSGSHQRTADAKSRLPRSDGDVGRQPEAQIVRQLPAAEESAQGSSRTSASMEEPTEILIQHVSQAVNPGNQSQLMTPSTGPVPPQRLNTMPAFPQSCPSGLSTWP